MLTSIFETDIQTLSLSGNGECSTYIICANVSENLILFETKLTEYIPRYVVYKDTQGLLFLKLKL